jgi:branched-chain amino acid transport system ATP-binding protein
VAATERNVSALLRVRDVRVRLGATDVLRGVDLDLEPGTVTGLIGPNGAGKTTLLDAVAGFVPLHGGSVEFDGTSIDALAPHERARRGIGRTFQSLELFDDLTVEENLLVAAESCADGRPAATQAATSLDVAALAGRPAGRVGDSRRKAVAFARAVAGRPKVLLLDEPAAGLDTAERDGLVPRLRELAACGLAVLVVDHDIDLVLRVCDRVVVLDLGSVIYAGPAAGVRTDPRVASAYVGRAPEAAAPAQATAQRPDRPVVRTVAMTAGYGEVVAVRGVDLDVRAGEVVALLGPNGAGKTTTLLALAGALRHTSGHVEVLGGGLDRPNRLARRGVGHVLQDHRVFAALTVAENLRLSARRRSGGVEEAVDLVAALRPLLGRRAGALSGGQQQLVAVARALAARPRLLLVDELSLGLAPLAVAELLDVLRSWSGRTGAAVLFAEQHVAQALQFADHAYVLAAGRVVLSGPAAELAGRPDAVRQAYLGGA